MKLHTIPALFGLIVSVFLSSVLMVADGSSNLRENVLRLHIPANSDSPADQRVKLAVRDRILAVSDEIFSDCITKNDILRAAEEHLPDFEKIADEVLRENGFAYSAHAEITEMFFDNRTYDTVFVPKGQYTALRITLGSGNGKNWWCVMYPALCLPCFSDGESTEDTVSESCISEEGEIVLFSDEEEIRVRLFFAEFFKNLIDENN